MSSAFDGVFRSYSLEFDTVSAGDSGDTDEFGNPLPNTEPASVRCYLKPRAAGFGADPVIRAQVGADAVIVTLQGRLIDPVTLPAGIPVGAEAALEFNGVPGTFRLEPSLPNPLAEIDQELGQRIIGSWRASTPSAS